jgi:hypothetical protein
MSSRRLHTELLARAGRLLLEYNESTGRDCLPADSARHLTEDLPA